MTYGEIYRLIGNLSNQLSSRLSSVDDASVNLFITGGSPGTISAKVTGGNLTVSNEPLSHCDATVTASSEDLTALLTGKLNPMTAMLTGRIKASGNVSKIMSVISKLR